MEKAEAQQPERFVEGYLEKAVESFSHDRHTDRWNKTDFSVLAINYASDDCRKFCRENMDKLLEARVKLESVGFKRPLNILGGLFWLSRNRQRQEIADEFSYLCGIDETLGTAAAEFGKVQFFLKDIWKNGKSTTVIGMVPERLGE